jgi:hypothetical protein
VSDIDTVGVDGQKVLDPKRPTREATLSIRPKPWYRTTTDEETPRTQLIEAAAFSNPVLQSVISEKYVFGSRAAGPLSHGSEADDRRALHDAGKVRRRLQCTENIAPIGIEPRAAEGLEHAHFGMLGEFIGLQRVSH